MARVYTGENVEDFIFGEGTTYEAETTEPTLEEGAQEDPTVEEGAKEEPTPEEDEVEENVTVTDEEMNMFGVIECVDEPEVACYRIALENEQNYNMIMNAMMSREFSVLESTGEEMVYEAADVKKFFALVKETVARWWSKIQGVFKNIMDRISEFINGDMRFVKKYEKMDIKTPETDKKFEGFNFENTSTPDYQKIAGEVKLSVDLGIKKMGELTGEDAKKFVETFAKDFTATKNKMRAYACGKQGEVTEEAFEKELKIALFGSEEKVELTLRPFKTLLAEIEYGRLAKGQAKQSYKSAEASVKALNKEIKIAENKFVAGHKDSGMKIAKCLTDSVNASIRIMSKALSMETRAIMANLKQNRAMAAFYVTNQPAAAKTDAKPEAKAESTVVDTSDLGIVLI